MMLDFPSMKIKSPGFSDCFGDHVMDFIPMISTDTGRTSVWLVIVELYIAEPTSSTGTVNLASAFIS